MPTASVPLPSKVSAAYHRSVDRHDGYDDALQDLREEIRGLSESFPGALDSLIRAYFSSRIGDIGLVLAEAGAANALEGLEELSIECSSGPEGEGEVLLALYAHLHGLLPG